ncbi:MAG: CHC2 zinc finger domain-containing protein [Solirubrobacteraceae bacterium]
MTLIELHAGRRHAVEEIVGALPDPPLTPRATSSAVGALQVPGGSLEEQLRAIPTIDCGRALAGLEANRAGKVSCPFHDPDQTPSLHCYDDRTWFCFGACQTGGSIYDFAARLWLSGQPSGTALRGMRFIEVRDRLAAIFLGEGSAAGSSGRVIDGSRDRLGRLGQARPSAER